MSFLVNLLKKKILVGNRRAIGRRIKHSLHQWIFSTLTGKRGLNLLTREEILKNSKKYRVFQFGDEESLVLSEPYNSSDELPKVIARKIGTYTWKKPFAFEVENAQLVGPAAVGFDEESKLISETVPASSLVSLKTYLPTRTLVLKNFPNWGTPQLDTVSSLVSWWSRNYYHWTTECLTRIEGLESYQAKTGIKPVLIIDSNPPKWQIESLRLLGYEPDDYLCWDWSRLKVKRLVVPSLQRERRLISPTNFRWLRQRVLSNLSNVESQKLSFSSRIYISRAKTAGRNVMNEDEVLEALSPFGFVAYTLENMSFADQVRLFSQAEIVVAPHGAGLTNMMFAQKLIVIELFASAVATTYFLLAKALGFSYGYLTSDQKEGNHFSGIIVDIPKLRALVTDMLSISGARQSVNISS